MSYISRNYRTSSQAAEGTWVCAPGSGSGPYKEAPPPDSTTGSPAYCGGCVSYVKAVCPSLPVTGSWKKGEAVKGNSRLAEGTVIATFDRNGKFHGHAAIYVSQGAHGVTVWDQYVTPPKPIGERVLRWGHPVSVNDGNSFYVVD